MELFDKPGIIIKNDNSVIRTTKVKKYITKNKIDYKDIKYLEKPSTDFKEVERSLKEMENIYLGLGPLKEKQIKQIVDDKQHYYCFWNKRICGWFDSTKNDLSDWPWDNKDEWVLIGESIDNEDIHQTHTRLWVKIKEILN